MHQWLIQKRQSLAEFDARLREPLTQNQSGTPVELGFFVMASFARVPITVLLAWLELPFAVTMPATESFNLLSRRKETMEFADSYTSFQKRQKFSVATLLGSILLLTIQLSAFGYISYRAGVPTRVEAAGVANAILDGPLAVVSCNVGDTFNATTNWHCSGGSCTGTRTMYLAICNLGNCNDEGAVAISAGSSGLTGLGTISNVSQDQQTTRTITCANAGKYTLAASMDLLSMFSTSYVTYIGTPAAPTALSINSVSTNSMDIAWTDNANNEQSFTIDRSLNNSTWSTQSSAVSEDTTTYNGTGTTSLSPNTLYYWRVKAVNGALSSTYLSGSKYTLPLTPNVAGSAPTGHWASSVAFTNAASWGGGGVQYYRYVWDQLPTHIFTDTESTWSEANAKCPSSSCTQALTALQPVASETNTNWYFHVRAYNGDGVANGSGTNYGPYSIDRSTPTSPTVRDGAGSDINFQASTSTLRANWDAAADTGSGDISYFYLVTTDNTLEDIDFADAIDVGSDTSITISDQTLESGITYYLALKTCDAAGNCNQAISDGVTIDAAPPAAPTVVNDGTGSDATYTTSATQLSANWTAVADVGSGLQKYQYAIGTTNGGTNIVPWTDNSTYLSVIKNGLNLTNGTYYFSVRAVDAVGNIGAVRTSNGIIVDATPPDAPAPVVVTREQGDRHVAIRWSDVDDPDSGIVQYDYAIGTTPGASDVVPFTDSGLATNITTGDLPVGTHTYFVTVRAIDAAGNTSHLAYADVDMSTAATPVASTPDEPVTVPATVATPSDTATTTTHVGSVASAPTLVTPIVQAWPQQTMILPGVAKGGQTLSFAIDGKIAKTITTATHVDVASFAVTLSIGKYVAGKHTISVQATDSLGRTSKVQSLSFTVGLKSLAGAGTVQVHRSVRYVVRRGDSLWSIAALYRGSGVRYFDIIRTNAKAYPSLVTNPSHIRAGWVLVLPATS